MRLIIILALLCPAIYFFLTEKQKTKNRDTDSRKSQTKKKEALDAILKNNKDRYQPD